MYLEGYSRVQVMVAADALHVPRVLTALRVVEQMGTDYDGYGSHGTAEKKVYPQ